MGKDTRRSKIGWLADEGQAADESVAARVVDVRFELRGKSLPLNHGYLLFQELTRLAPWMATEELLGVHPVHGADDGAGKLILNRRTKLVIRTPLNRLDDIAKLEGQTISIAGEELTIGKGKQWPLTLHTPLYAHCVTTGSEDEASFTKDIIRLLDGLGITCRFICGRQQRITGTSGETAGYSLMLHGLPIEHAILIQEIGLGENRKLGCGIFIPHKSIHAVT